MNMNDAVVEMTSKAGISRSALAEELGFTKPAGVLVPLSKARNYGSGMKLESVIRWAHQCGYDLVLQPAGCLVDGQLVLGDPAKPRSQVELEYKLKKAMEAQPASDAKEC